MSVYPSMIPVSVGSWYNPHKGAGQPSADLGGVGDTYLDTTNNVYYVKTESGWMDTKGSSALPSPTGGAGKHLVINKSGTAYTTLSRRIDLETNPLYGHSIGQRAAFKVCSYEFYKTYHFSFTLDLVVHGYRAMECLIDVINTEYNVYVSLSVLESYDWKNSKFSIPDVGAYYEDVDGTRLFYIGWTNSSPNGVQFSVRDFSTANPITLNTNYNAATDYLYGNESIARLTSINCKKYTYPEVSTSTNQVLVSDGNGGWSASAWVPVPACTSADAGKVLKVNSSGVPEWTTA